MADSELKVNSRTENGTAACRRLRAQHMIPAVIYGHGQEALPVSVPEHELELLLDHGARLLDISLDGKPEKVLIKEVQHFHIGTRILHLDLIRVSLDETIRLAIPIELRGSVDASHHEGGVVEQQLPELEVECLAGNIPDSFVLRVGELKLGDTIRAKDIPVAEGVTVITDPEAIVVSVRMVAAEAEPEEAVPGEGEPESAEPEVIGRAEEDQDEAEEK